MYKSIYLLTGVFWTLSNLYDQASFPKVSQKNSIIEVWKGSEYTSDTSTTLDHQTTAVRLWKLNNNTFVSGRHKSSWSISFVMTFHKHLPVQSQQQKHYENVKYVQLSQQTSTHSKSTKETLEKRSTTALNPRHLKGKRYDTHLTRNYCITISIQKINWIHKFNFKIQKILGLMN